MGKEISAHSVTIRQLNLAYEEALVHLSEPLTRGQVSRTTKRQKREELAKLKLQLTDLCENLECFNKVSLCVTAGSI